MQTGAIINRMTDEQKQMLLGADKKDVFCSTEGNGKLVGGLVNVTVGDGVSNVVARTGMDFDDREEAMDAAEAVIEQLKNPEVPAKDPEPKPTKEQIAAKAKSDKKKAAAKKKADAKAAKDKKAADKKAAVAKKKADAKKK